MFYFPKLLFESTFVEILPIYCGDDHNTIIRIPIKQQIISLICFFFRDVLRVGDPMGFVTILQHQLGEYVLLLSRPFKQLQVDLVCFQDFCSKLLYILAA